MKLEYYSEEKLRREILEIIGRYLNIDEYKVFFFGSRISMESSKHSDIDIGIEGPKEISASVKLQIEEDLEDIPTLYSFDLIDFKTVSKDFKTEAIKNIEYVK